MESAIDRDTIEFVMMILFVDQPEKERLLIVSYENCDFFRFRNYSLRLILKSSNVVNDSVIIFWDRKASKTVCVTNYFNHYLLFWRMRYRNFAKSPPRHFTIRVNV